MTNVATNLVCKEGVATRSGDALVEEAPWLDLNCGGEGGSADYGGLPQ